MTQAEGFSKQHHSAQCHPLHGAQKEGIVKLPYFASGRD